MNINLKHIPEKASPDKQYLEVCPAPRVPVASLIADPISYFSCLSIKQRNILNTIFAKGNNRFYVSMSQKTIAQRSHCSVSTVKRSLPEFVRAGILGVIGRHEQTSLFRVSDYFHNPRNRAQLSHLFRAFCFLPLMLLSVCNGQWVKDYKSDTARNELVSINNFKFINSFINLFRTKDNQLSVKRTRDDTMELKQYPNMHKRYESDNKRPWGNIVRKAHQGSINLYTNGVRPQCEGGSVKSELTRKKERMSLEDQAWRELESSTKELAPVDFIKETLSKQWWML